MLAEGPRERVEGSWLVLADPGNPVVRLDAKLLDRILVDDGRLVLQVAETWAVIPVKDGVARDIADALCPYTRAAPITLPDMYEDAQRSLSGVKDRLEDREPTVFFGDDPVFASADTLYVGQFKCWLSDALAYARVGADLPHPNGPISASIAILVAAARGRKEDPIALALRIEDYEAHARTQASGATAGAPTSRSASGEPTGVMSATHPDRGHQGELHRFRNFGPYRLLKCVGEAFPHQSDRVVLGGGPILTSHLAVSSESDCLLSLTIVEVADEPALSTWLAAARTFLDLRHLNLTPVLDLGRIDGQGFLAVPHVEGRDVLTIRRRAGENGFQLPIAATARIVRDTCRALAHAQDAIGELAFTAVARSTILVSYTGEVLLDLAAASLLSLLRRGGLGRYDPSGCLSPEECRGDQLDARSSVYSVGVVLWELLTGRTFFRSGGSAADFLREHRLNPRAAPPRKFSQRVPSGLDHICSRALEAHPDDRYSGCLELAFELEAFLADWRASEPEPDLPSFLSELFADDIVRKRWEHRALALAARRIRS